ncbi:MAG: DNA-binding protein WhiA [Clostridiales bacterium]|nr:DNA-binding protein WhiA [Clostridiales bacterium]
MSFATETKNELARFVPEKKCCMLAEIAGFMRMAGSIRLVGGGKFKIVMTTTNPAVARHYKTLIRTYFSIDTEVEVGRSTALKKSNEYTLSIGADSLSEQILRETGILMVKEGMNVISDGIYDGLIKSKCCRRAYLRGAFLAAGTINDPEKVCHFEINAGTENLAKELRRLMNTFTDINAKIVARRKGYGVYLKKNEQVRDALGIMEAGGMFLKFDNAMMMKELRGKSQRGANLDNANIDKALRAAEAQIGWIKKIEVKKGLDYLSPKLRETAKMRLQHPELGIAELGQMMEPPLKKSGINNRLRRIEEIANTL